MGLLVVLCQQALSACKKVSSSRAREVEAQLRRWRAEGPSKPLRNHHTSKRGPDALDLRRSQDTSLWSGPRGATNTAGASIMRPDPWRSAPWGRKERRHKGSARVGTPKTSCPGGLRWLARFCAFARTTAGATLLPLCALPDRMIPRARDYPCTVPDHYPVRHRWPLEPERAFASRSRSQAASAGGCSR